MSDPSIECVIRCPHCGVDKFVVQRVPTGHAGIYDHRLEPCAGVGAKESHVTCGDCGTNLERKPNA